MALNARTRCVQEAMRSLGITHPSWTIEYARKFDVPISLACSLLIQESGGGRNIFGHDPPHGIGKRLDGPRLRWLHWIQGRRVTKLRYRRYRKYRRMGYGMQGVGPMQLTWYAFQEACDSHGGTWNARANIEFGLRNMGQRLKAHGPNEVSEAIASYNGSGTAARLYAKQVRARADKYHDLLVTRCP